MPGERRQRVVSDTATTEVPSWGAGKTSASVLLADPDADLGGAVTLPTGHAMLDRLRDNPDVTIRPSPRGVDVTP